MSKPREFWIQDCGKTMNEGIMYAKRKQSSFFSIRVIEYAAYQRVVERLKEALVREHLYDHDCGPEDWDNGDVDESIKEYVAQEIAKLEEPRD